MRRASTAPGPPKPPVWFRLLFYSLAIMWIALQGIAVIYDLETLKPYAYLDLFDAENERQVDAVFINILVIGVLTIGLGIGYAYGIISGSKLTILACSAFALTLLILNALCIVVLYSSRMILKHGPIVHGIRQLNIYHKNMTADHWRKELTAYADNFPLHGNPATPPPGLFPFNVTYPPHASNVTNTTDSPIGVQGGDNSTNQNITKSSMGILSLARRGGQSKNATPGQSKNDTPGQSKNDTPYIDVLGDPPPNKTKILHDWYMKKEIQLLFTLGFVQEAAFCCGIDGYDDYKKHNSQMPASCGCRPANSKHLHVDCAAEPHDFAHGRLGTVWKRPCLHVVEQFLANLNSLRYTMIAITVPQTAVFLLSVILGLNMPAGKDSDDVGAY